MNRRAALCGVILATGGCAHVEAGGDLPGMPFELFQDNQLGTEFSLTRVSYSFDGSNFLTWRARDPSDHGSREIAIYEGNLPAESRTFVALATVHIAIPHGTEAEIQLKHVEPVAVTADRRLRLVFLLCPANGSDPLHAVMTQVEASVLTTGASRAPYVHSTCLTFEAAPAPNAED